MAEPLTTKQMAQKSLQANKDHQSALKAYIGRLEAELQTVDKLLSSAEVEDNEDEPELDVGGFILVPRSKKACSPLRANALLSQDSPFYEDAAKLSRYLSFTCIHPMKAKELDVLAEAVRTENSRKYAFEAQQRGQWPFSAPNLSQADIESNTEGLDWDRIAEKVSSFSSTPRTARECEIRWIGDRHPLIDHSPWSQSELARLKELVPHRQEGQINWVEIAKALNTRRTPIDCMRHALHRKCHIWDPQSDKRLLEAIQIYGTDNWNLVARNVSEDATAHQCSSRFMRSLDPTLQRGAWTTEEDSLLRLAVEGYGNSWLEVASAVPGRNSEQCRDRWQDRINPNLAKGPWTDEEDGRLVEAVKTLGMKWSVVSQRIGNVRTDKVCRLRYEVLRKRDQLGPTAGSSTSGGEYNRRTVPRRPRARRTIPTAGTPEITNGDGHHPPSAQPSRPKSKPRTKGKGKGKEVNITDDDPTMRTDQPLSQVPDIAQSAPPPRPKPRPLTKHKGKNKEIVAENRQSMEPEYDVADEAMPRRRNTSDNLIDPLLLNHEAEADIMLSAGTVTKKTKGKGKARSKGASALSIKTAKGSKRRAVVEDGDADAPALPKKKRKTAAVKNVLPENVAVGDAHAPSHTMPDGRTPDALPKAITRSSPRRNRSFPEPVSNTANDCLASTSTTTIGTSSNPEEGQVVEVRTATGSQPATITAVEEGAGDIVPLVRGASPALSELSELSELTEDEACALMH